MNLRIPHHKVVMIPRALIISDSEVYPLQFFFCYVHSITQLYESITVQKVRLQSK